MGCYNITCGVSQFPIIYGDETVNFIIVSSWYKSKPTPSYMNESWSLIPIPFYGEYDDYGWQDDNDDQQAKYDFLSKHFKDELACVRPDRAKDYNITDPFADSESLRQSINMDAWHLDNPWCDQDISDKNPTRTISHFIISKTVFDALTESVTIAHSVKGVYQKAEFIDALEKFLPILFVNADRLDELRKISQERKILTIEETEEMRQLVVKEFSSSHAESILQKYIDEQLGGYDYYNPIIDMLRCVVGDNSPEWRDIIPIKILLRDKVITSEDAVNVYLIRRAMDILRKSIYPMSGYGSQTGFEPEHGLLISAMQKIIELDKQRYGDE